MLLALLALKMLYQQKYSEAEGLVKRALEVCNDDPRVIQYLAQYLRKTVQIQSSLVIKHQITTNVLRGKQALPNIRNIYQNDLNKMQISNYF